MAKNKKKKTASTNVATQSNQLIQASYRMSVPAKRVMLMLLSQIHPGDPTLIGKKIRITAKDYAEKTGISKHQSYEDIKNGCRELMGTIITTKKEKSTSECVVVSWMEYHHTEGWLEATFTPWLAPYIQHLSRLGYTHIAVDEALKFKSFHTIRLYELLMQFRAKGIRTITLENLRAVFQIPKKSYAAYSDFRKWVLSPAIKEIQEKSSFDIDWEPQRKGRRIASILFIYEAEDQGDLFK